MSNDHDINEINCHASASVKSEIHASNNLIRETICELNLRVMATTMKQQKLKKFILDGVSTLVRVPLILPQRKRPSRIAHWKGHKEIV